MNFQYQKAKTAYLTEITMNRKDLEDHFDVINYCPIPLVYDTIQAEINELREGQIEIYAHFVNKNRS